MNESSKEEKPYDISLLNNNKLYFKKYKPIKVIGKGTFSKVYLSLNTKENTYVAIKAEKKEKNGVELLESEAFFLYSIRGIGIPEVITFGKTKTHNLLIMPLLGRSLLDLTIQKKQNMSLNDVCLIAIQILDRIEWIHSNNIIYRDIKPENFLFGKTDPEILYIIDFGLCKKYRSSNTGKHIRPTNLGKFTGTSRYASVYAMAGFEQSRRDDIESIGYMIIFLMKKKLPWMGIKGKSYKECYHKLYLMKKYMDMKELCKGLPSEMIDYMNKAKALAFEEKPDYKYLKNLFYTILKKNDFNLECKLFSWLKKEDEQNETKSNSTYHKEVTSNKRLRKSSPQNRLYQKIKSSIENKKNIIQIKESLKTSDRSDKTDFTSTNTEPKSSIISQNNNMDMPNSKKKGSDIIQLKDNTETSNTMKVMLDKNITSGCDENIEEEKFEIDRKENIFNGKKIPFDLNAEERRRIKRSYSPQNKVYNMGMINNMQYKSPNNNSNINN